MPRSQPFRRSFRTAITVCGLLIIGAMSLGDVTAEPNAMAFDQLKVLFKRPLAAPAPRGAEAEQVALGARLFREQNLSADQKMSCATCHDPTRGFVDGRRTARGNTGQDLPRNTPALWNLESARAFHWDGRSPTLEAQSKDAIERDGEMAGTLAAAVQRLAADPNYVAAFQRAFPAAPVSVDTSVTGENVLKAITAFERTLTSPVTRFDRWVDGTLNALTQQELTGLRIFSGKGRCLACHGGWRFTDDLFHDVGLRSPDQGRSALVGGTGRTFKTPSLREVVWTAPYMHDGSLRTLESVVAHYAGNLEIRDSLAPELKRGIDLNRSERRDLVAFLNTLSSAPVPRAPSVPQR